MLMMMMMMTQRQLFGILPFLNNKRHGIMFRSSSRTVNQHICEIQMFSQAAFFSDHRCWIGTKRNAKMNHLLPAIYNMAKFNRHVVAYFHCKALHETLRNLTSTI